MVSLNPDKYALDGGLLDMSLADVVTLFSDKEKRRAKESREDENEQEDLVGLRSVPAGLLMALDGNARRLDITRAMLTRCASHQVVVWLDSISRIKEVTELYNAACDAAEEFGYPDLYDSMSPDYEFANSSPRAVSLRTIRWVKNKLYQVAQPLGVPVGALFVLGLCYSLTHSGSESRGTISKYLSVEVSKFLERVDERSIRIVAFNDMVRRRSSKVSL